jgi:hypothetical protein
VTLYVGCAPGERLNARSHRAVFRVTVRRTNKLLDWFTTISLSGRDWRQIVEDVIDSLPALGGIAYHIGSVAYTPGDAGSDVATFDLRVGTTPGAATVQQLVDGIEQGSPFIDVTRVEWFASVPGFSEGGPDVLDDSRTNTQIDEQDSANAGALAPWLAIGRTVESAVILGVIAVALFLAYKAEQ